MFASAQHASSMAQAINNAQATHAANRDIAKKRRAVKRALRFRGISYSAFHTYNLRALVKLLRDNS